MGANNILDAPDPSCLERSLYRRDVLMNVADVGRARDIFESFPILKWHGMTALVQDTEDLEYLCGWWQSHPQQAGGALAHGKCWYLARSNWRLAGAETVSKMESVSLLVQEQDAWVLTFPQRLRLYITRTTVKEVGSFPGRWEMWVWSPHRLSGPPSRLDTYTTLKH